MDRNMFVAIFCICITGVASEGPRVLKLSPRQGSVEGATVLTITGEGFSTNQFSYGDGNENLGNRVFLRHGTRSVECLIQVYSTNDHQIVCRTGPAPEGWYNVFIMVDGVPINKLGGAYCRRPNDCKFNYQRHRMPNIKSIYPNTGPPGTLVTIHGDIYSDYYMDTQDIGNTDNELQLQRVYVGGAPCSVVNENTEELYGLSRDLDRNGNKRPSGKIICKVEADYIDSVNASFIISGNKGRSVALPQSYRLSAKNDLYMFQIHPEISTVSPQSGSLEGGTTITINGQGFETEQLKVTVGGLPCVVSSVLASQITCKTTKSASTTDNFGNRGLSLEVWPGQVPSSVDQIAGLNSSMAGYFTHVVKTSDTQPVQWMAKADNYAARVRGYFIPPSNNTYTFHLVADDNAVVYLSSDEDPANKVEIISLNYAVAAHDWFKAQSRPIDLVAGRKYYIKGSMLEYAGHGHIRIGVRIHNIGFSSRSLSSVLADEQQIKFTSTYSDELQTVTVGNTTQKFRLSWDGAQTQEMSLSSSASQVEDTLNDLLSARCTIEKARAFFTRDYDQAKTGAEWGWRMNIYSYCGRQSLMLGYKSQTIIFYKDMVTSGNRKHGAYNLERFNTFCFAYTGELRPHVRLNVWWKETGTGKDMLTERIYPYSFITDSDWHYACLDLMILVSSDEWISARRQPFSELKVEKIALETSNDNPTFVDEVFIGERPRSVTVHRGAIHPNGVYIDKIKVTKRDFQFNISVTSLDCGYGLPLISVLSNGSVQLSTNTQSVAWELSDGSTVEVKRLEALAPPVGGNVIIGFNGMNTSVEPDLSAEDMKSHLESAFPGIGKLEVKRSGDCSGHTYNIRWPNDGGAMPLFNVLESNLTGIDVNVTTVRKMEGGLLLAPIPGDMLRSYHVEPQVVVAINGVPASCYGNNCTFSYNEDATPTVDSMSPASGSIGTSITLSGSGFTSVTDDIKVTIGGDVCNVTDASANQIVCTLGHVIAGIHTPVVSLSKFGLARINSGNVTVKLEVTSLRPTSGSSAGGSMLTITGRAFSSFFNENTVTVGGQACHLVKSTFSQLVCTTPAKKAGSSSGAQVTVSVNGQSHTATTAFKYDSMNTAKVTAVDKTELPVSGGVVTITGTGFGSSAAVESPVTVGNTPCAVVSYNDTVIQCRLSVMLPGKHAVKVQLANGYADASLCSEVNVDLEVTGVWPQLGSFAGGSLLTIVGRGFSDDVSDVSVSVGPRPCAVVTSSQTQVTCRTSAVYATHKVSNMGIHPEMGPGYVWSPQHITITSGDWVEWQWTTLPGTHQVTYGVQQTIDGTSVDYDGTGFISERTSEGKFTQQFLKTGTYYYSAGKLEGVGNFKMTGVVTVKSSPAQSNVVNVKVSDVAVPHNIGKGVSKPATSCLHKLPAAPCSTPATPGGSFYFSQTQCSTPVITMVSPSNVTVGENITIQGSGFGVENCQTAVSVGGYVCDVISSSENKVMCALSSKSQVPVGVPLKVTTVITGLGEATVESDFYVAVAPSLTDFHPQQGSLLGGTQLTITGSGFSEEMTILLGSSGSSCRVTSAKYTSALCVTTSGSESPVSISVHVNGLTHTAAGQYSFTDVATPKVLAVTPNTISAPNSILMITGEGFNGSLEDISVSLGSAVCTVLIANSSHIECKTQDVVVGGYALKVIIGRLGKAACPNPSSCQVTINPVISSVSPKLGSTNGGTRLTITGLGFDNTSTRVSVAGQLCKIVSVSSTEIICLTPGTKNRLKRSDSTSMLIIRSNSKDYPRQDYEYSASVTPVVNSLTPSKARPGETVIISGSGFSDDHDSNGVMFGDTPCVVTSSSSSEVQCTAGPHLAGRVPVQVDVMGLGLASSSQVFEYELAVDTVTPTTGGFGGGSLLTLTGSGFDPMSSVVSLCDEVCVHVNGTSTSLQCLVSTQTGSGVKICDLHVKVPTGSFSKKAATFQYQESLTATLTSVNPTRGGTAGGTKVTVIGSNFGFTGNTVTIGGIPCIITSESTTQIECTTEAHHKTEELKIKVNNGHGLAIGESAKFHYVDVWSSPFTWGKKGLPKEKEFVIISKGQTVLLDVDTPVLTMLLIQGGQVIFDEKDVQLNSEYILITDGGLLQVGTEQEPFQHNAVITLHGHVRSKELPIYGAKVLAVRHGNLELHGHQLAVTWTKLSETVNPGEKVIKLMESVQGSWKAGDKIVIATTSHRNSQRENEELTIESVSPDGMAVTLTSPVQFKHLSTRQVLDGEVFEARAEVGMLTRNIVVQGSVNDAWTEEIPACPRGFNPGQFATQTCFQGRYGKEIGSDQFGSQIMVHGHKEKMASAHIEYVEVRHAGQAFRLGRYPIHFHMNGDVSGNYVRGCSIHHTFNRATTIHGSHNLLVEKNVAYNNMGHAFFIEDGIETNNTIQHNLGIFTRTSSSLLNTDVTPATFWVTNPDNRLRHNAAAGGSHFGFWYNLPKHPGGMSYTTKVCPRNIPVAEFTGNSAHSFGRYGLWIFMFYDPREGGTCNSKAAHTPGVFSDFIVWHCERGAEVVGGGSVHFQNFLAADNEKAGLEAVVGEGPWDESGPMMRDSAVIGWTDNSHDKMRSCTEAGVHTPKMSREQLDGIKFINFDQPRCAALRHCSQCKPLQGGFPVRTRNLKFINSPNKVSWKWEHEGWYEDLDGTLTGVKGGKVLPSSEILPPNRCIHKTEFSHGFKGVVCDSTVTLHRMALNGYKPESLEGKSLVLTNNYGSSSVPFKKKRLTHAMGWMAVMMDADRLNLHYENADHITNISYSAGFYEFQDGEYVMLGHNFTQKPDSFTVRAGSVTVSEGSESRLRYDSSYTGDWYFDEGTYEFTYMVSGKGESKKTSQFTRLNAYRCKYKNCGEVVDVSPMLGKRPENAKMWSNPNSWTNVEPGWGGYLGDGEFDLPVEGDDVMIPAGDWIIADVDLPKINKLYIYGTLELDDTRHHLLEATYIIIQGGRLVVGYPDSPFTHNVKIVLHGHHRTPDINFPDVTIGSKAIGVLGGLDLHGSPVQLPWTRLSQTVNAGDSLITLEDAVDWKQGDEIVVTPTGYDVYQTETFRIEEVVSGKILRLNEPLKYRHLGDSYTVDGKQFKMAAEVGLLTRNIVIEGYEEDTMSQQNYGARVVVSTTGMDDGKRYRGFGRVSNVEFRHTGQEGFVDPHDPRFSLSFLNVGDITEELPSYVKSCSFHDGFSTAIGVFGTNNLEVVDNVIHHTVSHGVEVEGQGSRLVGNLVTLTLFPGTYNGRLEPENLNWVAGIMTSKAADVILRKNAVAGSEMLGYWTNGEKCSDDESSTRWQDNSVHSCLHGVHMFKYNGHPGCSKIANFFAYRNFDYGIYFQTKVNMEVADCILAENGVNVMPMGFDPPSLTHRISDKYASISRTLVVGSTDSYDCSMDQITPVIHTKPTRVQVGKSKRSRSGGKLGVMWPTFTSSPNGAPFKPWDKQMSYPTINGILKLTDVTFAEFNDKCGKSDVAIHTAEENGDCMHPIEARGTRMVNVTLNNKVFIHYPMLKWVNPSDCVDMDCDAQKKAIIRDLDGGITGLGAGLSTIIPQAEYEWDGNPSHGVGDYRIPKTMLTRQDGSRIPAEDVVPNKGLYRPSCKTQDAWHAHVCQNLDHNMIVIESLDADTETRRVSPISLVTDGYVDLINGPMDHGWCFGYTCQERISTFYGVVATGKNYEMHFTGTTPQNLRVHLLNVDGAKAFVLGIWYSNPQRLDVYHNGVFVAPTNADMGVKNYKLLTGTKDQFMPKVTSPFGTNWMDKDAQMLYILVKGSQFVEVKTMPIIQLSLELGSVTLQDFYKENLVRNLADLLKISPDRIRVMEVVRETRLRRAIGSETLKVKVEIGDPPLPLANTTQKSNNSSGNYRGLGEDPMTAQQLNSAMSALVNRVQLGNDKLGNMSIVNMQVVPSTPKPVDPTHGLRATNTSVQATSGPLYGKKTSQKDESQSASGEFSVVLPQKVHIHRHPVEAEENALFTLQPQLYMMDAFDDMVPQLGMPSSPWELTAAIVSGPEEAVLLGKTTVKFENGWANFTDLAITGSSGSTFVLEYVVTKPSQASSFKASSSPFTVKSVTSWTLIAVVVPCIVAVVLAVALAAVMIRKKQNDRANKVHDVSRELSELNLPPLREKSEASKLAFV